MAPSKNSENEFFLPDFCSLRSVFAVVVLVELFAFVITLASTPQGDELWNTLSRYSLFMQWVGLLSATLLCLARRPLSRLSDTAAGLISYVLMLLVIGLFSLLADITLELVGFPDTILHRGEFLLRNLGIGAIACALTLRYFYVTNQWHRRIRAEAQAKLDALQARIRPHFLFNSINTVSNLIHDKPDDAEEALLDLADLFRASLRDEQRLIPLGDELALSRRYLNMERLRLGERLQTTWQLGEGTEQLLLPPLLLQPLVENAVYHGIEPRPEGGTVSVSIQRSNGKLTITISNPLPDTQQRRDEGNRIALENIRARLRAHYAERASLQINEDEKGYRVTITLPAEEATA